MQVDVTLMQSGYCCHPQAIVEKGATWKPAHFPALYAHIMHPLHGHILFDTGYSDWFFKTTQVFPFRLYKTLTPVHLQKAESAVEQLAKQGVQPSDVGTIIISHFHADHIAGLKDFPNAQLVCSRTALKEVLPHKGW